MKLTIGVVELLTPTKTVPQTPPTFASRYGAHFSVLTLLVKCSKNICLILENGNKSSLRLHTARIKTKHNSDEQWIPSTLNGWTIPFKISFTWPREPNIIIPIPRNWFCPFFFNFTFV